MLSETNIEKTQSPFISKIWYGNPQNNLIEGTLTGIETKITIGNQKDLKDQDIETIKQFIWDFNLNNKYITTNKLCCINMKNKFSVNEFVQTISTYLSYITTIRVYKSPFRNIYYIYIEFKNVEFCNIFYNTYNYAKINPVESEYMIFAEIQTLKLEEIYSSSNNNIINTSNTPCTQVTNDNISSTSYEDSKVCTICIETLEKIQPTSVTSINTVNGIIYVLCGHAFHIDCFIKLDDDKCPLCRYYLSPPNVSTCERCTNEKDLWMCLVCGKISCGDEGEEHRVDHYKTTGHIYAQGIGEKHNIIFDFLKNSPVHIWIHNSILSSMKEDIIDTNEKTTQEEKKVNEIFKNPKEKVEYIMSEYNSIISSQLENQRFFYMDKIRKIENKYLLEQKDIELGITKAKEELKELEGKFQESEKKKKEMLGVAKEKNKKIEALTEEFKKTEDEYNQLIKEKEDFEQMNKLQSEDIDKLIKNEEEEIEDLNQQLKDLRIHIKTINSIEKRGDIDGIKNASLGVLLDVEDPQKKKHHHNKHKK